MRTIDAISKRRSIRHFKDLMIHDEDIARILKAGILAPSAKNKQPWFIHVIKNQEMKNQVADFLMEKEDSSMKNTARVIKEAPVLLLIFKEKEDLKIEFIEQSIGALMENMCLEARSLEIGSLWIGHVLEVEAKIKKLMNEKRKLSCALSLGYPMEFPENRPRKELKEMIEVHEFEEMEGSH